MKEAEFTKDEFLQMNSAADRRVYFLAMSQQTVDK